MHMADALISPVVGAGMWGGTLAAMAFASKKMKENSDDRTVPLMGVLGAFIFAAQMVNFTIPGTGSSGHLGGGMILAILLGPFAAFLVMASVLTVQALFFADGGLLALGCNIWNLGIYPCFLAYPLIYQPLVLKSPSRILIASLVSAVIALQLGAFSVVMETTLSGNSELPFGSFLYLMQPIHLAIGTVEGLVTAGIIGFVRKARPEILESVPASRPLGSQISLKKIVIALAVLAALTGGALSWFASTHPDGLEWAIRKLTGTGEPVPQRPGIALLFRDIQERTVFLPDYNLRAPSPEEKKKGESASWPGIEAGTSAAGLLGAAIVLAIITLIGFGIRFFRGRRT